MSMPEIKTRPMARLDLPVQFSRLRDIAYNLWWSWTPSAQALFELIDPVNWSRYRSPIEVLIDLDPERWNLLQNDQGFIRSHRALVEEFDSYMAPREPTWFQRKFGDEHGPFVYFSTEYGCTRACRATPEDWESSREIIPSPRVTSESRSSGSG